MPKVKISEYSATANSNTDVASINIDEGCAPSGINNAIRAVMGHLKDFQQGTNGDPFNGPVNGTLGATTAATANVTTLTTSSTITHNGGTANGVAYLNGSKVLTTGSALVFDGTNLGVGVTPSAWSGARALEMGGGSNASYIAFNNTGTLQSYLYWNAFYNGTNNIYKATGRSNVYGVNASGEFVWFNAASGTAGNAITFTQAMTLDASGNLGVGTTSITSGGGWTPRLVLAAAGGSPAWIIKGASSQELSIGASDSMYIDCTGATTATNNNIIFRNTSTNSSFTAVERARIDSSGNLLVGTTSATGTLTVKGTSTARAGTVISLTDSSAGNLFKIANDGLITTGGAANPYGNTTATGANAVFAADGVFYRSTSALKYKQDIRDIESIDIAKFRPIRYKSKCNGDDQTLDHFGIVADEVDQAGIKELVSYGIDGQVEGFQYERLTVVLLKAIQEQQALIQTLTARITALESA